MFGQILVHDVDCTNLIYICQVVCLFVCLLPVTGHTGGPIGLKFGMEDPIDPRSAIGYVEVGLEVGGPEAEAK